MTDAQMQRLRMMTESYSKWDLSPNDVAAIRAALDELAKLRLLASYVRDDLVPIVEMDDVANDPGEDLYVVMHQVKDALAALPSGQAGGEK